MRSDFPIRRLGRLKEPVCKLFSPLLPTVYAITLALCPLAGLHAQALHQDQAGIAWRVQGVWKAEGVSHSIRAGDAIFPGTLLEPGGEANGHSVIVFLPDGQRILYECFTQTQCERGFRVPDLYRLPEKLAVSMLSRVRASLPRVSSEPELHLPDGSELPREEAVAALEPGNHVNVQGLASSLPDASYTYELRRLPSGQVAGSRGSFDKKGASVSFVVPAPGLYDATIFDKLHRPRIDLFLVAARPSMAIQLTQKLQQANALLLDWNENYQGWPIHEFQRAYLESLVLGVTDPAARPAQAEKDATRNANVTDEPTFSPRPGLFDGDTRVELRCGTPGAVIHFTVDSSQPVKDSLIYEAPVVVKGTELTIKAFASAPGKKDSPVVTGIFRIRQ